MPQVDYGHAAKTITANGIDVQLNVEGYGHVGFAIASVGAPFSGTFAFQARVGGTWVALAVSAPGTPGSNVTTATADGTWFANVAALTRVRVISTAWNSGTAQVDIESSGA